MEGLRLDFVFPLLGALLAGTVIGLERSYRAHPAGFRTHAMVCVGACLLMLTAVHQLEWMAPWADAEVIRVDPVRMAHGILTGIGFLCGGVIFREGFSVHGLTTAASLWLSSALGILYGAQFYSLAIGGTVVTLVILGGFRFIDERLPRRAVVDVTVRYKRETAFSEPEFRELLTRLKLRPMQVSWRLLDEGRVIEHASTVRSYGQQPTERLANVLVGEGRVLEFHIDPRPE